MYNNNNIYIANKYRKTMSDEKICKHIIFHEFFLDLNSIILEIQYAGISTNKYV